MTSPITTHVLDTSLGRPAAGVPVMLEIRTGEDLWKELSRGVTDADGRISQLLPPGHLAGGVYRLRFDTDAYFRKQKVQAFYPHVTVEFLVSDAKQHYHVPLLLNPYGYSTYRGS
jgi:5-hydroxyisourate hydrolase